MVKTAKPICLRSEAYALFVQPDPIQKCLGIQSLQNKIESEHVFHVNNSLNCTDVGPSEEPGRPDLPLLVDPKSLENRGVATKSTRAVLLHALCHIEFNAINLALDAIWRFSNMPELFYWDWWQVAKEEAYHFQLLNNYLPELDSFYGAYPAHNGLWEMALRTKEDILARLALVPRTMEARGLDVTPAIQAKLLQAGDQQAADILSIILHDEIGHVAIGNRWYNYLCEQQSLDPISIYQQLAIKHKAPRLRGPFNLEARLQAGFKQAELDALLI